MILMAERTITLTLKTVDGTAHWRVTVGEHISLVQEPGFNYLGHIKTESGSSASIKLVIIHFLGENGTVVQQLVATRYDGTAMNTGKKSSVIRLLEEHVKCPLQWSVCLLHENELPLCHLFQHIDSCMRGLKFRRANRFFIGKLGGNVSCCY